MSEINGQTDDVALLVNWFFCRPFPPYENLKVDMAVGRWVERLGVRGWAGTPPLIGVDGQRRGHRW